MTAPNVRVAEELTASQAHILVGTTYSAVLSNATTSNAVQKVSCVNVCNISSATSCAVTVAISNGTTYYRLVAGQGVTASIQPVTRSTPVYLREGDSLCIYAGTSGYLEAVAAYETFE